jgi:hypothetical protein
MGVIFNFGALLSLYVAVTWDRSFPDLAQDEVGWRALFALSVGVFLAFGIPFLIIGLGLAKLRPWARVPAIGVCVIALFAVPIGTLFGALFLSILLSNRAKEVLAPND